MAGIVQSARRSAAGAGGTGCREMPKPQQLDTEMAQLRVQRLRYEDLLNKQPLLRQIHQADGQPLTAEQKPYSGSTTAHSA
ncbi:mechanosensitive ion channel family protein [Escherichia coli]|nr:mechanosensitive ion channel family protein [Escherichia coli]